MQDQPSNILMLHCQNHRNKNASYFQFIFDQDNKIHINQICSSCAFQHIPQDKSSYLILKELIDNSDNNIITNWPPLNNNQLMMKFINLYDDISEQIMEKQIIKLFETMKNNFLITLNKVKKQMLMNLSQLKAEDLIAVYNDIAQRHNLKESISSLKYDSNRFQQMVEMAFSHMQQNNQKLENIINKYEQVLETIDLDHIQIVFNQINENLNGILIKDDLSNDKLEQQPQNETKIHLEQELKSLNKKWLQQMNQFKISIQDNDKYSFIVHSNQVKEQLVTLQAKLFDSDLAQKIKMALFKKQVISNQNDLSIRSYKIRNSKGNYYGYIDTEITCEDIGKSFGIQIKNLVHWIGIGIIDKVNLTKNSFQSKGDFHEKICYFISHNGYSWSLLKESQYKKQISFQFKTNDVLVITILSSEILFQNKTTQQEFRMDFQFNKDLKLYPGFRLFDIKDEILFI